MGDEGANVLVIFLLNLISKSHIKYTFLSFAWQQLMHTSHYSFYLNDGMSILELGAAEESYLPPNIKLNKHVGVGAVQSQMDSNPSITSSYVVDLNNVIEDVGLNNVDYKEDLEKGEYDAVIMANTIDFLINPREVFK